MVQEVAVLIGLQASGKTTFYARHLVESHVHVSKDNWPNARHRQRRQLRLVAQTLAAGQNVAVDNTNPARPDWQAIGAVAAEHAADLVGYWFPPDVEGSITRNAARSSPVPDVGLFATLRLLERPTPADFTRLYIVTFDGAGGFDVTQATDTPGSIRGSTGSG